MRGLIALAGLLACGGHRASTYPAPSCLKIDWQDSSSNSLLPRALRLDPAKDTLSPMAFNYYHLLKPVTPADSNLWFSIMHAWWYKDDQDSLALMLNGVDAGWTVRLGRNGTSFSGHSVFWAQGTVEPARPIAARPIRCAESPRAGV
jgi:hypothetical protein